MDEITLGERWQDGKKGPAPKSTDVPTNHSSRQMKRHRGRCHLLTIPNQLGVEYNARVIEAIPAHVAPALGWC